MEQFDILSYKDTPIKQNVVISITKENTPSIDQEMRKNCKILKLSSTYNFDEKLTMISDLELKIYPNLFIFIIEENCFGFSGSNQEPLPTKVNILREHLFEFVKTRPMVVQLKSIEENITKFYFKLENCEEFVAIQQQNLDQQNFTNFPSFLWLYLNNKIGNLQFEIQEKIPSVEDSTLILKFLRTLDMRENFFYVIGIKCAEESSISDFLAAIDGYIDEEGVLRENQHKFFSDSSNIILFSFLAALKNSNQEIIKFLISHCKKFIKNLPHAHQLGISKTAFKSNQIETLCILLESFDFPFPHNLHNELINNERLQKIVNDRIEFYEDISRENLAGIENFIKNSQQLMNAYDFNNTTVLIHTLIAEKFRSLLCLIESYFNHLNAKAVRKFILKTRICCLLITSKMSKDFLVEFIDKIKAKTDSKFIATALKAKNGFDENLFFNLVRSESNDIQEFKKLIFVLEIFLTKDEIIDLMMENNVNQNNILQVCAKYENLRQLGIIFKIFKGFFDSANVIYKFKELIGRATLFYQQNMLQIASTWIRKESHQALWTLLQRTFQDREELKNLIIRNECFVHLIVIRSKIDVVQFTFKKIKAIFNDDQYEEILHSKGFFGRNLLHQIAAGVNDIEIHYFLLKIFREFHKTDKKLIKFLKDVDSQNNTILHLAATFLTPQVFDFLIKELERIVSREKVKDILSISGHLNKSLLQFTCRPKKYLEMFKNLWKVIKKYFNSSEILDIIQHNDENDKNLLINVIQSDSKEILKIVLDEVQKCILKDHVARQEELMNCLIQQDKNGRNVFHTLVINGELEKIEFIMKKFKVIFSYDKYGKILKSKERFARNSLQLAVCSSQSKKTHKVMWEIFREFHKSNEDFLKFLKEVDSQNNSIIHLAAVFSTDEIFIFLITELERIASQEEIKDILSSLGQSNKNLFQLVLRHNRSFRFYSNLWTTIQKYFEASEILEIIKHTDVFATNLLQIAAECKTSNAAEFTWNKIQKLFNNDVTELTNYLKCTSNKRENIMHAIVKGNDEEKLVYCWIEFQKYFTNDQFKELVIQRTLPFDQNILHFSSICDEIKFHEIFWTFLLATLVDIEELMNLIMQNSKFGNNFLHNIVNFNKSNIIEFILLKLKETLTTDQYEQVLMSKGQWGRNLLQKSVCGSNRNQQILWNLFKKFFKSNEKFLDILLEVDIPGSNYYEVAVSFGTGDSLQFIFNELQKIASFEEIKSILSKLCFSNQNLLQAAARNNKLASLHNTLWKIMRKFFNRTEIFDMIQHKDKDERDLLLIAMYFNNKDIVKITWNEIKQLLDVEDETSELVKNMEESLLNFIVFSTSKDMKRKFEDAWKKFTKEYGAIRALMTFKLVLSQNIPLQNFKVLHELTKCDNLEYHKDLWTLLLQSFDDKKELKYFLLQKNYIGLNFIHHLILNSEIDVVEFSFETLKKNFSGDQYQQFLAIKEGKWDHNLLQMAASECKNIKIFKLVWKSIQNFYNSEDEFLNALFRVDKRGSNFFHLAGSHATAEIFEFILHDLELQIKFKDIVRKIFKSLGYWRENLLQATVMFNKSTGVQDKVWKLAENNLSSSEIIELIRSCDRNGDNLLHEAVFWNTKETVELTWKNIQKYLTSFEDKINYFRTKGHYMASLEELAKNNLQNDLEVCDFVRNLNLESGIQAVT